MSESEGLETKEARAAGSPPQRNTQDLCQGLWRLKPNIVLRVEEDGAILFDPDTDALTVVNLMASALLQWRRDRICFDEWCEMLHAHYRDKADLAQIRKDVKGFLNCIAFYTEACDGKCN